MNYSPVQGPESNIFEIVTELAGVYTFRYVEEGIRFLYEVFCGVGDCVWGGGVFCSKALCGVEGLYGLVLRPYDVRDRGDIANRRFFYRLHKSRLSF